MSGRNQYRVEVQRRFETACAKEGIPTYGNVTREQWERRKEIYDREHAAVLREQKRTA